jgi:hypothetical protein
MIYSKMPSIVEAAEPWGSATHRRAAGNVCASPRIAAARVRCHFRIPACAQKISDLQRHPHGCRCISIRDYLFLTNSRSLIAGAHEQYRLRAVEGVGRHDKSRSSQSGSCNGDAMSAGIFRARFKARDRDPAIMPTIISGGCSKCRIHRSEEDPSANFSAEE